MSPSDLKTIDDFIAFYEAIPEEDWCCKYYHRTDGRHCAIGHLYAAVRDNADGVVRHLQLMSAGHVITAVNDGRVGAYQQSSPKARILAYLKDVKKGVQHGR